MNALVVASLFVGLFLFSLTSLMGLFKEPLTGSDRNDHIFTQKEYDRGVEERELRFERFTAWTECPNCLKLDLHRIKDVLPQSCRRICSECDYVWRQV